MASSAYLKAIISVQTKAREGVKYSELTKVEQAAADHLAKRRKVTMIPIKGGDWIVNL
jgi:hypothetical protein